MRTGLVINYALSKNVKKFSYTITLIPQYVKIISHIITLAPFKAVLPSNLLFQRESCHRLSLHTPQTPACVAMAGRRRLSSAVM